MKWCVYRRAKKSGSLMKFGCHPTKAEAQAAVKEYRENQGKGKYATHTFTIQREFTH